MAQNIEGLYSILKYSTIYSVLQKIIAREDSRRLIADQYILPKSGDRVVDIGCGPAEMLSFLGEVDYTGIDLSERYIAAAQKAYGQRGRFLRAHASDAVSQISGPADIVLAIALLHHLDDAEAGILFDSARKMLRPGGRLITVDCVWMANQNPIARLLIGLDRGKNVRTRDQYVALARQNFTDVESVLRDDFLRVPYNHCIMVCRRS